MARGRRLAPLDGLELKKGEPPSRQLPLSWLSPLQIPVPAPKLANRIPKNHKRHCLRQLRVSCYLMTPIVPHAARWALPSLKHAFPMLFRQAAEFEPPTTLPPLRPHRSVYRCALAEPHRPRPATTTKYPGHPRLRHHMPASNFIPHSSRKPPPCLSAWSRSTRSLRGSGARS